VKVVFERSRIASLSQHWRMLCAGAGKEDKARDIFDM